MADRSLIVLDIGGERFITHQKTLQNFPSTRLAKLTPRDESYNEETGVYFFDRSAQLFHIILDYYRIGELHVPHNVCGPRLQREFSFWGIEHTDVCVCCWKSYSHYTEEAETLNNLEALTYSNHHEKLGKNDDLDKESCGWRHKVWLFLDDPRSCTAAKVWAYVFMVTVLLSIGVLCMETHPLFRVAAEMNKTMAKKLRISNPKMIMYLNTDMHPALLVVDWVCLAIFSLELGLRLVVCPSKIAFMRSILNVLDLVCIIPIWVMLMMEATTQVWADEQTRDVYFWLAMTRVLRVFRVFKMSRQYEGMRVLLLALKSSIKELVLLVFFLLLGVLFFSSLVYYAEFYVDNQFSSIPMGFWWSIITMTTVGYGDIHPCSVLGYVVGSMCAITGLLVIGLPIPVIANNFNCYYTYAKLQSRLPKAAKKPLYQK